MGVLFRAGATATLLLACQAPRGPVESAGIAESTAPSEASLVAEAEKSGFHRTGRYPEVERLCHAFEQRHRDRARCLKFGTTPEGRPLLAMAFSDDGVLSPEAARAKRRPVILVQGGIHAGEIDGKDGGFWAMRELVEKKLAPGALSSATVVFIPAFNADGHERFGPNHRPNQRGPEQMGFRTTGQNINLNRDYVKAEAPEMQALLGFFESWDPVVYVDIHTTDGAKFQHAIAVLVEPSVPHGGGLDQAARGVSDALQGGLSAMGHLPLRFYPSFRKTDEPSSGFGAVPGAPRLSQVYAAVRNRIGILVETHSWQTNERRVRAVHDFLAILLTEARTRAASWRDAADAADASGARLTEAPLKYRDNGTPRTIEFRGYAYEKRPSEISGVPWILYDETRPEIWRVPLFDQIVPALTVTAPRAGYVVPAAEAAWVSAKLRLHGLRYETMKTGRPAFPVETFRADEVAFGPSFEGRTPATVKGAWRGEPRDLPPGSLFVPIAQPRALLLMHLLEPIGPDSLVSWGYFNGSFERKEYMEEYVIEQEARKMLAANPSLRAEFEAQLKDAAFAGNPKARLDFFYRRHPAWDERVNLVPLFRVARSPL